MSSAKKPFLVKLTLGLIIYKLCIFALTIFIFYLVKDVESSPDSYASGIRKEIIEVHNLEFTDNAYGLGLLIGKLLIPIVLNTLAFIFFVSRKFLPLACVMLLDLVVSFSQGFPLLTVVITVLIFAKPTQMYLAKSEEPSLPEN